MSSLTSALASLSNGYACSYLIYIQYTQPGFAAIHGEKRGGVLARLAKGFTALHNTHACYCRRPSKSAEWTKIDSGVCKPVFLPTLHSVGQYHLEQLETLFPLSYGVSQLEEEPKTYPICVCAALGINYRRCTSMYEQLDKPGNRW